MKFSLLKRSCLLSSVLIFSAIGFYHPLANAEGSRTMVQNGGDRPYTEWDTKTTADIIRQTLLRVYIKENETVYFGSSVPDSANAPKDIVVKDSSGTVIQNFDVKDTGECFIDTVDKEESGPANVGIDFDNDGSTTDGYNTQCSFSPNTEGIYQVEFRAPQATSTDNPDAQSVTAPFDTDGNQFGTVSAWDITVVNNGEEKKGRVFTKYIALNMGSNGRSLNSEFFIQTKDGYRYLTNMNGLDPFGFLFFSNNRGFIDETDDSTLYHSAKTDNNELTSFFGNVVVQDPTDPDDATNTNITHLVFFNRPDPQALDFLGIPRNPATPPTPENFSFTGNVGDSGNQTIEDAGGNFTFDVSLGGLDGSYRIIIDTNDPNDDPSNGEFNPDGKFDPSVDTVLRNPAVSGTNVVEWDGKDNDGNIVPQSNDPYDARITLRFGEYHFPMLDPENNPPGLEIELENAPSAFPEIEDKDGNFINRFTVYYDESNYTTADGTEVKLEDDGNVIGDRNVSQGTNSQGGTHAFDGRYGDFKGIDTWTYFPSTPQTTEVLIAALEANVNGTKSAKFLTDNDSNSQVTPGDIIKYTVTYTNLDEGNTIQADDFVIKDALPSDLTYVGGSASIDSQTNSSLTLNGNYDGSSDTTLINSGTFPVDASITITFNVEINDPISSNPILNQARAEFTTSGGGTNKGSGTVVTDADSNGGTDQTPNEGDSFGQEDDNGNDEGNDPSNTADDDPTEITVVANPPQVLLVKRITQVNGSDIPGFDNNDGDNQDDNALWPTPKDDFLRGAVSQEVKPGDTLEYTIYYLSAGGQDARNVTICDLIPEDQTFVKDAFNDQGVGTNLGIAALIREDPLNNADANEFLTNVGGDDEGRFLAADVDPPNKCDLNNNLDASDNTGGLIIVDVVENPAVIPAATSSGTPPESYGFIRFRTKVE